MALKVVDVDLLRLADHRLNVVRISG